MRNGLNKQAGQRVMPTCIFILSRLTLRVDNVLFRAHDVRLYHSYTSSPPLVVRESSGWEAPYDWVKKVCADIVLSNLCSYTSTAAVTEARRLDASD